MHINFHVLLIAGNFQALLVSIQMKVPNSFENRIKSRLEKLKTFTEYLSLGKAKPPKGLFTQQRPRTACKSVQSDQSLLSTHWVASSCG